MFSADYRELLSGRRKGAIASLLRTGLYLAQAPYALAMHWRNARYDRHPKLAEPVSVPVISVGNITTGGTGKTPLVAWLARWFRERNVRVSILSRGYGAEALGVNDEALELEHSLPDVPHLQDPNRVASAQIAIDELATQLILLDDAFQHRRIHRDLNIVLLDALEPFGYGHVLPRGLLREPLRSLARAQVVVLSRADLVSADRRAEIRRTVERYAPQALWVEANHRPRCLLASDGSEQPIAVLAGKNIAAFCGIGHPAGFRQTLERCGCQIALWREFPDHHAYTRADLESLTAQLARSPDCHHAVCTHKDLVKIGLTHLGEKPLAALAIGIEFTVGQSLLETQLEQLAHRAFETDLP